MARPKLMAARAPNPDLFIGDLPAREVAPGPDRYFCTFCGVATWTPYTRRQPVPQQWLRPSWTACDDPDCRARVDAAVTSQHHQGSAAA